MRSIWTNLGGISFGLAARRRAAEPADGTERALDAGRPGGCGPPRSRWLAGVMGVAVEYGLRPATKNILIESAWFEPGERAAECAAAWAAIRMHRTALSAART